MPDVQHRPRGPKGQFLTVPGAPPKRKRGQKRDHAAETARKAALAELKLREQPLEPDLESEISLMVRGVDLRFHASARVQWKRAAAFYAEVARRLQKRAADIRATYCEEDEPIPVAVVPRPKRPCARARQPDNSCA